MDKQKVSDVAEQISKFSYDEKKLLYDKVFSIGVFGDNIDDTVILFSLISLTYIKIKVKNPKIKVIDILNQITKNKEKDLYFSQMLETLSILIEDMSYESKSANNCGLKTSNEIINKIKELLYTWTPF